MNKSIDGIDVSVVRLLSNKRFEAFCNAHAGVTPSQLIDLTCADIRRLFMVWWSLDENEGGPSEAFRESCK